MQLHNRVFAFGMYANSDYIHYEFEESKYAQTSKQSIRIYLHETLRKLNMTASDSHKIGLEHIIGYFAPGAAFDSVYGIVTVEYVSWIWQDPSMHTHQGSVALMLSDAILVVSTSVLYLEILNINGQFSRATSTHL